MAATQPININTKSGRLRSIICAKGSYATYVFIILRVLWRFE